MFKGSIVALVTPLTLEDEVDYAALSKLVDFHLQNGTDAIVAVGTTGESGTLSLEEQHTVTRHVIEQVAGKIPVIAGTGATSTKQTIENTKAAMALGVDAVLIMTPAYIKPTQEGLFQHYQAVAKAAAIPQILYNVPGRTACDMQAETVIRLAALPNVIGVKEATGDLSRSQAIMDGCGDKLDVYSGDDPLAKDIILAGGKGVISVTANVAPKLMHEMCMAALAGDSNKATEIDQKLTDLHKTLFLEANPIPVKWAVHKLGLIPAGIRLPLTPLTTAHQQAVAEAMQKAGID